MGNLVFQATLGGQVNLVGPNTASTYNINVPTVSGDMVTTGDTGTVTNTMLAGSIANAKLVNSSFTLGSTAVSLGETKTTFTGLTLTNPTINGYTGDTSVVNIGSGQFYKDTSGNVGLGVTPSAWDSSVFTPMQIRYASFFGGITSPGDTWVGANLYYGSGSFKYIANGYASYYRQSQSQHEWSIAASGTAGGAISFTDAMVLDASANLKFNSGYGSAATAYGCRAWVNFNGTGTPAIRASGNVSTISDGGTGQYTVNFSTSMPDANFAASVAASYAGSGGGMYTRTVAFATGSLQIALSTSVGFADPTYVSVSIYR